ncbi:MAG TPA: hypothetical protein VJZ27_17625, partial [Aggregatilineales bacterium]|nr:hypothetical protein [Aggregatilineales bacterium]
EFANENLLFTMAAAQVSSHQLVFLGGSSPDSNMQLYGLTPGNVPYVLSDVFPGRVTYWEWSDRNDALLIVTDENGRKLWVALPTGTRYNITPVDRAVGIPHWD